MKKLIISCLTGLFLFLTASCTNMDNDYLQTDKPAVIYPDYKDVTIPVNVAPLNFCLKGSTGATKLRLCNEKDSFEVKGRDGSFRIPARKWSKLLQDSRGKAIKVIVISNTENGWMAYTPFQMHVAAEAMDGYLAYRLIAPGYTLWNQMGIYQRNLENYTESAIYENKMTDGNCVNCHSFCMQNPGKMLFHMRATHPCTFLIDGDKIEKLNTKTDQTLSALVYPSWHPSGRFIASSVNKTTQNFNPGQRVEVYDTASDVVVYDVQKHEIVTSPFLFSAKAYETFPTFSPDGKTLYFCTAQAKPMPENMKTLRYSLCRIAFNPGTRRFGQKVDTLFSASMNGKSATFPRVSPDGRFLLFTISDYGTFPIWHKEADLRMIDLVTGRDCNLEAVNSNNTDSYHSWSSNGRWIVFSSRRLDGLYTRPYFAYIGKDGVAAKPFLLPQKKTDYYQNLMKSYNIPEFITGKVPQREYRLASMAKKGNSTKIAFDSQSINQPKAH